MSQPNEPQQPPAGLPPVTVFRREPDLPGAAYVARVGTDLAHRYRGCSHDEYGEYVLAAIDHEGRVLDFGYRYPEASTGWRGEKPNLEGAYAVLECYASCGELGVGGGTKEAAMLGTAETARERSAWTSRS